MPRFKTTQNILLDNNEYFDENWMDVPFLQVPEYKNWDYSRELQIEDIDIWEVISEISGPTGVYAAYVPYAEFYLIIVNGQIDSTYYGKNAAVHLEKYLIEKNIPYPNQ